MSNKFDSERGTSFVYLIEKLPNMINILVTASAVQFVPCWTILNIFPHSFCIKKEFVIFTPSKEKISHSLAFVPSRCTACVIMVKQLCSVKDKFMFYTA